MATTLLQRGLIRSFGSALTSLFSRNERTHVRVYADGGKCMNIDEHGVIHIHGPAPSDLDSLQGIDAVLGVMVHECAHGWCGLYPWFKWFIEETSHHPKDCPKALAHAVANVCLDIHDERAFSCARKGFQYYLQESLKGAAKMLLNLTPEETASITAREPWKIPLCLFYYLSRADYDGLSNDLNERFPDEMEIAAKLQRVHCCDTCTHELLVRPTSTAVWVRQTLKRADLHRCRFTNDTFTTPIRPLVKFADKHNFTSDTIFGLHTEATLVLHLLHTLYPPLPEGAQGNPRGTKSESEGKDTGDAGNTGDTGKDDTRSGEPSNPGTSPPTNKGTTGTPDTTGASGNSPEQKPKEPPADTKGGGAPTPPRTYDLDDGGDPISELHRKIMDNPAEAESNLDFLDTPEIPDHLAVALLGLDVDKREIVRVRRLSRQHARSLLVAPRSIACQPSARGGRMGNITRLPVDGRVFNRRARKLSTNTAVAVLLDASYSIRSSMRKLSGACQGMVEGLLECSHVSLKCWSFSDDVIPLPPKSIAKVVVQGSTNTRDALKVAHAWLSRQPEPSKIILIFTDGEPNTNTLDAVKYVCEALHRRNIILVGGAVNGYTQRNLQQTMPHAVTFSLEKNDYSAGFRKAAEQVRRLAIQKGG